jgi:hypothetical protein
MPRFRPEFSVANFLRGTGWFGFVDLPSRIFARRLHGIGWPARICAVAFSGRRKYRKLHRPLCAALIVAGRGQRNILWFSLAAILGIAVLYKVGIWYKTHHHRIIGAQKHLAGNPSLTSKKIAFSLFILIALIFQNIFI